LRSDGAIMDCAVIGVAITIALYVAMRLALRLLCPVEAGR
jgi:hypothetical protein